MNKATQERNFGKPLFVLAAIMFGLVLLFPRYADQSAAYLGELGRRAQLWWAMRSIEGVSSEAMEIDTAANGDLWVTSKYSVLRVAASDGRRTPVIILHQVRQAAPTPAPSTLRRWRRTARCGSAAGTAPCCALTATTSA